MGARKKGRGLYTFFGVLLILGGIAVIAFPFARDWYMDHQTKTLQKAVDAILESAISGALEGGVQSGGALKTSSNAKEEHVPAQTAPANENGGQPEALRGTPSPNGGGPLETETGLMFTREGKPLVVIDDYSDIFSDYEAEYDMISDLVSGLEAEYDPAPEVRVPSGKVKLALLGRIRMDRLQINMPIVEGTSATPLKYAIGHLYSSAHAGEKGNFFLAGHRAYTYGRQFNRLGEAEYGDLIVIQDVEGGTFYYVVDEIYLVDPKETRHMYEFDPEEYRITLQTCHPLYVGSYRLIVRGTLAEQHREGGAAALPTPRPTPEYALDMEIERGTPTRPPKK